MKAAMSRVAALVAIAAASVAGCSPGRSAGVVAGTPTGVSFLQILDRDRAISAAAGVDSFDGSAPSAHVDWITHRNRLKRGGNAFYIGAGLGLKMRETPGGDDIDVGIRLPVGLTYTLYSGEANMFAEVAPAYWFDLEDADLGLAVGIRFHL